MKEVKKEVNTKDLIVQCAFVLFLEKGYKEVTLNNIMEVTNLSKGAIYHHFSSKEAIYNETLQTFYFDLVNANNLDLTSDSFKENIESLYTFIATMFGCVEYVVEDKLPYAIRNFFSFQLESEHHELIRTGTELNIIEQENKIKYFVVKAMETGQISNQLNVEAVSLQILGMIEGVAIHHSTIKENVKEELLKKYKLAFDNYLEMICLS